MLRVGLLLVAAWCLAACSSSEIVVAHEVPLATAKEVIAEEDLLDVGIVLFDSGVPEGEVPKEVLEELIRDGTFVQIRRSESVYMSVLLRNTLQKTGSWGSVWIAPEETAAADVTVAGRSCIRTAINCASSSRPRTRRAASGSQRRNTRWKPRPAPSTGSVIPISIPIKTRST
jgi:hypothetical protein